MQQLGLLENEETLTFKKLAPNKKGRKTLRNSGMQYTNVKGNVIDSKVIVHKTCKCRYSCSELTIEAREDLHSEFWKTGNWDVQTNYLMQNICTTTVTRQVSTSTPSRRQYSRSFKLNNIRVCQRTFTSTLGISASRIHYALKKKKSSNSSFASPDQKGRTSSRKISDLKKDGVKIFLNDLPRYRIHYSPSVRQYFHPDLTKADLYKNYKEIMDVPMHVSEKYFRNILREYNVGFYVLKSEKQIPANSAILLECKSPEVLQIPQS